MDPGRYKCFSNPFLLILAAVLCSLSIVQTALAKKYAFFVGVEAYDPTFLANLSYPEEDVAALGVAFEALGFDVIVMTQSATIPARRPGTSQKIMNQLRGRLRGLQRSDTLVVGFSGHGVQFADSKQLADGTSDVQFFCPEEANLTRPDSLVPLGQVYKLMNNCPAERKLMIVDACRNEVLSNVAKAAREIELRPAGISQRTVPKGMLALFSCAEGQKSFELQDLGHGIFCHNVLNYLSGKAPEQFYFRQTLGVRGLVSYVSTETRDVAFRKLSREQLPEFVGRTTDWSFGALASSAQSDSRSIGVPGNTDTNASASQNPADRQPGEIRSDNGLQLKLVWCPPGTFMMGSPESDFQASAYEKRQHSVRLTRGFWIGQTEVTQRQWHLVIGGAPGNRPGSAKGPDHPATNISWDDAVDYCMQLTNRERKAGRLAANESYRLPTEAEWEYACRGGTTTTYHFGDEPRNLRQYEWFRDNTTDIGENYSQQVGQKTANRWNLMDMHGNVSEWCLDYWKDSYDARSGDDPRGPKYGKHRVFRGGSFRSSAKSCRSGYRFRSTPDTEGSNLGFRVTLVTRVQ